MNGPGKYDDAATCARLATGADAVVLVVLNGSRGSGFSAQSVVKLSPFALADLLENMARKMRAMEPDA